LAGVFEWIDLDPLAFILPFLNQFWISSRLVCNLCEVKPGSLSVATTAVSSPTVSVTDFVSLAGMQCIASMIMALGHCLGIHPH
jgi:hypothetical protein